MQVKCTCGSPIALPAKVTPKMLVFCGNNHASTVTSVMPVEVKRETLPATAGVTSRSADKPSDKK